MENEEYNSLLDLLREKVRNSILSHIDEWAMDEAIDVDSPKERLETYLQALITMTKAGSKSTLDRARKKLEKVLDNHEGFEGIYVALNDIEKEVYGLDRSELPLEALELEEFTKNLEEALTLLSCNGPGIVIPPPIDEPGSDNGPTLDSPSI